MSKEDALAMLSMDEDYLGSLKDPTYEREVLIARARKLLAIDRAELIEALRYWLSLRHAGKTLTAVEIAEKLHLTELKPDIEILRKEIVDRKVFLPDYVSLVDMALDALAE